MPGVASAVLPLASAKMAAKASTMVCTSAVVSTKVPVIAVLAKAVLTAASKLALPCKPVTPAVV